MKNENGALLKTRTQSHLSTQTVDRLSLWQRWEHGLMALSILLLILSGVALAYHEHDWAKILIQMMGGIKGRHLIHRIAAVGLLGAGLLHFVGLFFSPRHQQDFRKIKFKFSDLRNGWKGFSYAVMGNGELPHYGWFTPMQKLQYWGVMLGCVVMGVSGLLLWNPLVTLRFFPKWVLDVMFVFHAKEAQLIFVVFIAWHLYDVHIAGGNFPMNPAWLTGRMSAKILTARHGATPEEIRQKEGA